MEIKEACKPPAFGPIGLRLGNKHVTPQDYLRRDEQPAPGHGDIGRLANIAPGRDQGLLHSVAPWRGGHRDGACPPERPVHGRARTRMRIAAHRWHAPHRGAATVGLGRPRPPPPRAAQHPIGKAPQTVGHAPAEAWRSAAKQAETLPSLCKKRISSATLWARLPATPQMPPVSALS